MNFGKKTDMEKALADADDLAIAETVAARDADDTGERLTIQELATALREFAEPPPPEPDIEVKRNDYITIRKGARILSFTPEQAREVRDSLTRALQ